MNNEKMLNLIREFPNLVKMGYSLTDSTLDFSKKTITNIIYAGMGGSALAGDVIRDFLFPFSKIGFEIIRNYNLPEYAGKNSFIIISSFSGNTEETISCFKDALKRGSKILAVSSGGEIERIAKTNRISHIKLPIDIPPRTAFGMTLFCILRKIESFYDNQELKNMIADVLMRMDDYSFDYKNAKMLSKMMQNRIPIFYTDTSFSSVGRRCANQMSENAKHFAHFNLIPEMNHNEIVGLEMPKILKKSVVIFFLSFRQDNSRNKKRNLITKRIVDKNSFVTISINFEDANPLFNIIDSVILFDLASYYLALFNKVDPMAVKRISLLKNGMKK
ncbi:MAG: bifunctional phosphoglucose/phosphomannose isomerase [bacterium (Candidatus Stahlbacteria) CG23_combo_of_CG06-09_8_20_14_all_34_7]|nr:MAG: bifunctional phosphoglucose/phosphomannose isomerase [bacterium (Candidatus Stahlbacteria) CG23_combo_of_CG06-09_8_20_14_all_34_7]